MGVFSSRPPINETQLTDVSWISTALQADPAAVTSQPERVALQKGLAWLADAKEPDTFQSKVSETVARALRRESGKRPAATDQRDTCRAAARRRLATAP